MTDSDETMRYDTIRYETGRDKTGGDGTGWNGTERIDARCERKRLIHRVYVLLVYGHGYGKKGGNVDVTSRSVLFSFKCHVARVAIMQKGEHA